MELSEAEALQTLQSGGLFVLIFARFFLDLEGYKAPDARAQEIQTC